jgi:hypothetical protein
MSISFTQPQINAISRRQITAEIENAGYAATVTSLMTQQQMLLNVDNANVAFYGFFDGQVRAYESEYESITGEVSDEYTNGTISPYAAGDLSTSAAFPGSPAATFFPSTPTAYTFNIPKIGPNIQGVDNPTSQDAQYEVNTLNNPTMPQNGINNLIAILTTGISGATSTSTTYTGYAAGSLMVSGTPTFTVGDLVFVGSSTNSGIYSIATITAAGPNTTITITSVIPSVALPASGSITNTFSGFPNSERQTLIDGTWQEILTNTTTQLSNLISTIWLGLVSNEVTQIGLENDTRSPQQAQNAAQLIDNNNTLVVINTWTALSNTGASGKFTDSELLTITNQTAVRSPILTTRAAQILIALRGPTANAAVIDNGNGTYSGLATTPYYQRYQWLDVRIDRIYGSATRYFQVNTAIATVNTLSAGNTTALTDYSAYFTTIALAANANGTNILQLKSSAGLSVGTNIHIVSDTQPPVLLAVMRILDTTQIQVSAAVPNTYLTTDTARVYQELQ